MRACRARGVALSRIQKTKSWIPGKKLAILLPQLTQCFAPCLMWGTDTISLTKSDRNTVDVAFFRFLRHVYQVRFDGNSFTKTNQELLELSGMKPPSELIPLAHLKFLFHLLSEQSIVSPEPYLNGLIDFPTMLTQRNKIFNSLANTMQKELEVFKLLHVEIKTLSQVVNQKNIFQECATFGSSTLARIIGRVHTYEEESKQLPQIDPTSSCAVLATDASFFKTEWGPMGSFAIVDTFGHRYVEAPEPGPDPSSTAFELAAIHSLLINFLRTSTINIHLLILVDSLSSIRLCAGKEVRTKELKVLREIDERTIQLLDERNVTLHYVHVRSHRKNMVYWNDLADRTAGEFWSGLPGARPKRPETKCGSDCSPKKSCSACEWNLKVMAALQEINTIEVELPFWTKTSAPPSISSFPFSPQATGPSSSKPPLSSSSSSPSSSSLSSSHTSSKITIIFDDP